MELRKDARYHIAVLTSMGLRMTPAGGQPSYCTDTYKLHATSAESNVATIPASLGCRALALTNFVKDSPMSEFIRRDLRARGIEYTGREHEQGGPWGLRHQFNIADSGAGVRGPVVHNDRAGEVGRLLAAGDFDTEQIFGKDGVQILHLSGLIAALSESTGRACIELAALAKKHGTRVSFDLNHRASFWKGRQEELSTLFSQIAALADILVGNEEDFQLCLGIQGPKTGGRNIEGGTDGFKKMIENAAARYPGVKVFATTLREVISANAHKWGAIARIDGVWTEVPLREIAVIDRIGGGDAFVGGLLYGILKAWDAHKTVQFAWATGAAATTFTTDYALPANEKQIFDIYNSDARVKR